MIMMNFVLKLKGNSKSIIGNSLSIMGTFQSILGISLSISINLGERAK